MHFTSPTTISIFEVFVPSQWKALPGENPATFFEGSYWGQHDQPGLLSTSQGGKWGIQWQPFFKVRATSARLSNALGDNAEISVGALW